MPSHTCASTMTILGASCVLDADICHRSGMPPQRSAAG
eukprot:COSAG06_NODE_5769_length_3281_cov_3.323696_1_plen_38_part_00